MAALAAENRRLEEELALETRFSVDPTTSTASDLISRLKEEAKLSTHQVLQEVELNADLQTKIRAVERQIADERSRAGGITAAAERSILLQRKIVLLQERLHNASARRSTAKHALQQLRESVNGLRRESLSFKDLQRKLTQDILDKKFAIMEAIGQISELQEGEERAVALCARVSEKGEERAAACEAEWRQLTRLIEAHRREEFERKKEDQKKQDDLSALYLRKIELSLPKRALKCESAGATFGEGSTLSTPTTPLQRLQDLEENLQSIARKAEAESPEHLVDVFLSLEKDNYELFAQLHQLDVSNASTEATVEDLNARIQDKKLAIEAAVKPSIMLQKAVEEAEGHANAIQLRLTSAKAVVDRLVSTIAAISEEPGNVNDSNLIHHIGLIEQQVLKYVLRVETASIVPPQPPKPIEVLVEAPSALPPPPPEMASAAIRARQRQAARGKRSTTLSSDDFPSDRPLDKRELRDRATQALANKPSQLRIRIP